MTETRVQFNTIVSNQLPAYVREDFPLISEILKQYYLGQEYQGGPVDLIQNIDRYIKLDNTTNLSESAVLSGDLSFDATTINVDPTASPNGTIGFPDSYGLIKIGKEIITYTGKTNYSFTGCIRGFVGISSYKGELNSDEVVFNETDSDDHQDKSTITNLSCLFLKEFLLKTKHQLLPGLEDKDLDPDLNQNIFIKQSKDFYLSKGTDISFEILFKALYNKEVKIVKPRDFLLTPSNAKYEIVNQLVVEPIEGNPENLENATLYQDQYDFGTNIKNAYAPITSVEKIEVGYGKTFYKLNIDAGYNRDIRVNGPVYGEFNVYPSTRVIGAVSSGSTVLDVDSTVGFGVTGELYLTYPNNSVGIVSYTSKSTRQFYGVSNLDFDIPDGTTVGINTFAYGRSNLDQDEIIRVRIDSVLGNVNLPSNTSSMLNGGIINVSNLGISENNLKTNKWFYNISPIYKVNKIELVDSSNNTYKVTLNVPSQFRLGDSATLIGSADGNKQTNIISVLTEKSFTIRGQGSLNTNLTYKIQRRISKVSSTTVPSARIYSTDVDNVYKNENGDYLVSSPSLPKYNLQPINTSSRILRFSGTFVGDEFEVSAGSEHGYYTGDSVYYAARLIDETYVDDSGSTKTRKARDTGLFDDGLYFVKRINESTLKFARSREDVYNSKFVSVDSATTVSDSTIRPFEFKNKFLEPQRLLRRISNPLVNEITTKTKPGLTGILANGVEISNYKSKEVIRYGKIESIEVLAPGSNIDVITPPSLQISDTVGTGATGHIAVSGSFQEIRVIDPGFDFLETPTLKIEGGNGTGAIGHVNLKSIDHEVNFFADVASAGVTTGTAANQSRIGFSTYHKFRNAEEVIYNAKSQNQVGGIVSGSSYYVSVINNTTVRLHKNVDDAVSGINTVFLTSHGIGKHSLKSKNKKSVIHSVNIVDSGSGYENKKRTANASTGISTFSDKIVISNHGYNSGERVKYTCNGTPASGLNANTEYYVTKIDNDSFKLSQVGVASDKKFYYNTRQYVDISSVGVGTHIFNYPEITVSISGNVGILPIGSENFKGSLQPVVRGSVSSVHVENGGSNYGSEDIINLDKQPKISLESGTECQLKPIVNNGKIVQIIVLRSGSNYISPPDLIINGAGFGAVLTPVLENGSVRAVNILESGSGYDPADISIDVISAGATLVLPEFRAQVQTWTVNLFEKYSSYFGDDDGIITTGINTKEFGLQYAHLYAPRKLRESVFSTDQFGNVLYGEKDLRKVNSIEVQSSKHSPIIGFAYDGHPIYGPYGFVRRDGGAVSQMRSGYVIDIKDNRPSTTIYPEGFFVEDYTHKKSSDDTVLDENNGRFCITPEFPTGTYAYFATVSNIAENSGVFKNYFKPIFPYLIGDNYKGIPDSFNFLSSSTSDTASALSGYRRNTYPYNMVEDDIQYSYLNIPNKLNQTATITSVLPGVVDSIGITTGGDLYKVGDPLVFNNQGTGGDSLYAKVSLVKGKTVSNISFASSIIDNVEFYPGEKSGEYLVFADDPHNFKSLNTVNISGLSTTSSQIEGSYSIGVTTNRLTLTGVGTTAVSIGATTETGLVTYLNVSGDLTYPSKIKENDILGIATEKVKVLNIDPESSRIRVLREVNGSTGSAHTIGSAIVEDPRKLTIRAGFKTDFAFKLNRQIYFDPAESVGLGTTSGVGIGTTISFSNPGAGITERFVPTKSIYIRNHNLETGDELTYSPGTGGSGIFYEDQTNVGVGTSFIEGQTLFVAKVNDDLIGIATVKVGLGTTGTFVGIASTHRSSTTVFFSGIGIGDTHSFTTNYNAITGTLERDLVTVSTSGTHGLSPSHRVSVKVSPNNAQTITVKYNDFNRRLIVNPLNFVAAGINTVSNTISINSHGFKSGDKVIYTASSPSEGLSNNGIYYVTKVDSNTIKLSNTYHNSVQLKPVNVNISSASDGTINPITPHVKVYKKSTVTFDLSDSSLSYVKQGITYSAFAFKLYLDQGFKKEWETSKNSATFELSRSGKVGTANAKVVLDVNDNTPEFLYYNLDPIFESDTPKEKSEIIFDPEVTSANELSIKNSIYNGNHSIAIGSTNTFTYTLNQTPEKSSYSSPSVTTYETDCTHTDGSIAKIDIINPGKNYKSLPSVTTVTSANGTGAILETKSSGIGSLKSARLNDIGFGLPSDTTLNPRILLPQILKVEALASFESIGITSFGRGLSVRPKLVVLDGRTGERVPDVDLDITLGNNVVEIFKNTNGMSNVIPTIVPANSGAGVGIDTVTFDSSSEEVTATLSVGFSTVNSFPFEVGDKVLIEGISVGVGSTGKGYNSSNYNYKLFDVTGITTNLGGIGSVTYSMSGLFKDSEFPGQFDFINSSGKILAKKHFPVFDITLETRNYVKGETVRSGSKVGVVDDWNPRTTILTISSDDNFEIGKVIEGDTSKVQGIASSIKSYDSFINLEPKARVINGWQEDSGRLNFELQKIQDSFYYQNFSYSLKSEVPYQTWNDTVSSLNHTLGFRKFSDYQLVTKNSNSMAVGLTTSTTRVDNVNDLQGFASLHCVEDFDLVTENNLNQNSKIVSDEIIFSNRILTDYYESIGNRVLSIDDISSQFNSNPRSTQFSTVNTFNVTDVTFLKFITYVRDKRYNAQRQLMLVDLLHDGSFGYLNQYARVETQYDQGSFDFSISGTDGRLEFYPTKYTINDYDLTVFSYGLNDAYLGIGSTSLGGVASVETSSTQVSSGTTATIVSIANTYTSVKVLVNINPDTTRNEEYESVELSIINDGSNVDVLEYGRLTTNLTGYSAAGLGTYNAYVEGSSLKVDFIPSAVGIATTGVINTIQVGLATDTSTGIGTISLSRSKIEARTTSITSSATPGITTIAEYTDEYDAAYFIVQVTDTTNNNLQMSEIVVVDDFVSTTFSYDTYQTEYAILESASGLGTFGSQVSAAGTVSLLFTPVSNIDTVVNVYTNALCLNGNDALPTAVDFTNGRINNSFGSYTGTDSDIKRSFEMEHENLPIFERYFEGNDSSIVDITNDVVIIPNHFFVSGEKIKYVHQGGTSSAIGIATTSFVGTADTSFLPGENLYAVKVDDNSIGISTSAESALKSVPELVNLESVGIGTSHRFISTNQNAKVVVALDNLIQSPVVSSAVTTTLADQVTVIDDLIYFAGITSFFGADLIKIGDEIMKIEGVGIGSTNAIRVRRSWLGTNVGTAVTGDLITKVTGNYNIVDNKLNFVEAPFGNTPIGSTTNPPDERDWEGISVSSSFQGRSFMKTGTLNGSNETYHENYIFDNISDQFNATENEFTLKQNGSNITGINTENAIILINDIFQSPGVSDQYLLNESSGITSITFQGTNPSPLGPDVGFTKYPKGGIIVSVGSTEGFGYQPLVSAGGTATVSGIGTIEAISIGNSGSGYRVGVQTVVNVGVGTSSTRTSNIEFIGTAAIEGGHIVSVAITNPGSGYTATNQPYVFFDDPLSYSNMELHYSSSSTSGFGTQATANIVVGQGSSVIDFEIINTGYAYGNGEILTVSVGGTTGIPTTSSYSGNEFQITIDKVQDDKFGGWSVGFLQVLDNIERYIDGTRTDFPLTEAGNTISIVARKGSKINVQDVLIIVVNNILQVPGEGYTFNGGSIVTFTEPLKVGDTVNILFYKGNGDSDVPFIDIIETVKKGDSLQIKNDPSVGQRSYYAEDERIVTEIKSTNVVGTNPYEGPGNITDVTLERPVTWCRQTEDKFIDQIAVGKDRQLYEPVINPLAYLVKSVGIGSTIVYVDTLRPLFNSQNENNDFNLAFQKKIKFVPQETKIAAAATAIVSGFGTISSISISDGGFGYSSSPSVTIGSTSQAVGLGTTAVGVSSITAGIVTTITLTNAGTGYTNSNPPPVLIAPPTQTTEECDVLSYYGDNGTVVGFGSTTVGIGTQLFFDIHIPFDSFLRNTTIAGTAVTISGITTNDYFVIRNSNVGLAATSITSLDASDDTVGVGISFVDNVYQVASAEFISTSVSGVSTQVRRVFAKVDQFTTGFSGITTSDFVGSFSWGRIDLNGRSKSNSYNAYTESGSIGISTSTMIIRKNFLKSKNYII